MFRLIFNLIVDILIFPFRLFLWIIETLMTIIIFPFELVYLLLINIDNLLLNIIKSPFILVSYLYKYFTEKDYEIDDGDSDSHRYISQNIKDQVWKRDGGGNV